MLLNLDDNRVALAIIPVLRLAFRPFFLGGAIFSMLAIAWWSFYLTQHSLDLSAWQPYGGTLWWHGHEMIFGFTLAIIAGFLLTAVQTWTGVIGIRGIWLLMLFLLWETARILLAYDFSLPLIIVVIIDCLFALCVAGAMAYPILKVKQWRNLMFLPILLAFSVLNITSHYAVATQNFALSINVFHGAILLVTLVVSIIGGRVIPMFTTNGVGLEKPLAIKWLEFLSLIPILLLFIIALVGFNQVPKLLLAIISAIAFLANSIRFVRWNGYKSLSVPLVWSLHFGYVFIPIGFLLLLLFSLGLVNNLSAALHSFTLGGIGAMIIAMMARVSLGHTGRPLIPNKLMTISFLLITIAGLVRVFIPIYFVTYYNFAIVASGLFWALAYLIYVLCYGKLLVTPRADNRPG